MDTVLNLQTISSIEDQINAGELTPVSYGRALNPDLFRIEPDQGKPTALIKTFQLKHPLVRWTIGRFITARERRFLELLQGIKGICKLVPYESPIAFAMEWIPGKNLRAMKEDGVEESLFDELNELVKEMHKVGVVHLDLAHKGNILGTADQHPYLIDFQAALYVKHWPEWIVRKLQKVDTLAVLKWKAKLLPQTLSEAEKPASEKRKRSTRLWPFRHWIFLPGSRQPKRKL